VKETITSYVGLDIHKASVALAIADAGRAAPRFIGTINPSPAELCKAPLACKEASERVERITQALRELCPSWRMNPLVKALMCLKGLDFVGAVIFVAEIGDLSRFEHPRALMSYLGLVPSEYLSGASRRQGAITKCGNKHARRILVESAWTNRFKAQITRTLEVRQEGQPKILRDISWKAQLRLSKRWRSLGMGRKLNPNKICIAIARELAGFIWDIGRHVTLGA
jgi:transposase